MLAGALMVWVAAGFAVMKSIADDFDQRVAMESQNAGLQAQQLYSQQEKQLAAFARLVAGMPSVGLAIGIGDPSSLTSVQQRLVSMGDLSDAGGGYVVFDRRGRVFHDGFGGTRLPWTPLTVQAVLAGGTGANQGLELINGKPMLIGAAPIMAEDATIGAVGIIEPFAEHMLAATQSTTGYPCSVFDPSGRLIATSSPTSGWPTAFPAQQLRPLTAPVPGESSAGGQHVPMPDKDMFLLPLFNPRGDLAAIVGLYQPTSAVRKLQWNVQSIFLALVLAGFLVSATVAWLFSRMIVRPIRRLAQAADEIASGEYDHPVPLRGSDEIGQLTQTFERMRQRIRETRSALVEEKGRSEAEATVVNAVLNATNDGIMMVDAGGRFRIANRRWETMFGIESPTLVGLPEEELRARLRQGIADEEAFDEASVALLRDPERVVFDEQFTQRWPEPRRLRRFSAPVRAQDSTIIGRVFVYQDISRERQADELKQALLSTVSHEFRTPLTTIKGYASTLLLDEWTPETRREFLRIIDEEADKLSELVDNLLDLSKIEAGVLQIHRQPVLLCHLIARVVRRRGETSVKHQFVADCPQDLPLVEADPRRLEQVLENLIENARKYSDGGVISIRAASRHGEVEVEVSDEGRGIPIELVERVFERFYRIDNSLSRGTGGTGLGLSICRGLIEAHGGHIWVKQTSPAGTTIAFTLPVPVDALGSNQMALLSGAVGVA